jgi:hypothetical protein
MNMPLVTAAVCALVMSCALAGLWAAGRVGPTRVVRTQAQARKMLEELTSQAADEQRAALTPIAAEPASAGTVPDVTPAGPGSDVERARRRGQILDAAVPGSLALGAGVYGWLTPDPAAVSALTHVTGTDIDNAFDFHSAIGEGQYALWKDGSLRLYALCYRLSAVRPRVAV